MAKMKFPNPKFFRAKDNVDWKAQGRNLQEVGGIIWDMLKETDWPTSRTMSAGWSARPRPSPP